MSMPTIPDITPKICLSTRDVANMLFASIALEEMALAHIVNSEAEKIQFVLGTLKHKDGLDKACPYPPKLEDVFKVNELVKGVLREVIKKEIILDGKLDNTLDLIRHDKKDRC